jgi:PAS domain S-box-containing protein
MHSRQTAEHALLESEERYRAVIGALEDGIVLHEADGTISSCNASACRILGLPESEIVGRTARNPGWRAIREDGSPFEPESHPASITLLTGLPCSHVIMGIEKADGARAWVSINSRPLCRPGEQDPYAVAISFTDITRRKLAEEELRRRACQQSAIAELGRQALEGTDLEVLLDEAVRQVASVLGVEHCKVVERLPRHEGLRLRAGIGWKADASHRIVPVSLRRRVVVPHSPDSGIGLGRERLAGLSVPIPGRGRSWGLLSAHTRQAREFSTEDNQFLHAVANVLAVAIERQQDQETVRAGAARHRALVEALPDLIFRIGRDGTYLYVKSGRPRELFASPRSYLGKKVTDRLPPEVAERALEKIEGALAGSDTQILEYDLPRGGEMRSYEARIVQSGKDEVLSVVRDITPRKRFENEQDRLQEAIRKSAVEWRLTFDAITHPVMLLEIDGKIIRVNEAARDLAGLTYEQVLHRPVAFLWRSEPWRAICTLLPQVEATAEAAATQARDEQGRTWDVSLSPVTSPDEQRGVVVVARDITDLVRLQESLRRCETMSAMGALVAGVAHEVRNPLFGISATLDAFASRFKRRTEYRRYLDILQGEVGRLSELMQQLLDYGKPFRLVLSPEAPREVMRVALAACAPLAAQAGVELVAEEDASSLPSLPPVPMDRNRILQVFQNLLENAIQHSPAGARVEFRAATAGLGERDAVRFTVEDAGPGFRPEDLPHIFEPFFTRRRGGTGLGLSIVQRIVEHHEGEIATANRPEGGAAVAVTLPLDARTLPKWERVV